MERIRILLVEEMPRLLRDIVESAIDCRTDMAIVARVARIATLPAALDLAEGGGGVDVVVLHVAHEDDVTWYEATLFAHPRVRLLALAGDGRLATLYALRPHLDPVLVASPEGIVDAIRAAVPAVAR